MTGVSATGPHSLSLLVAHLARLQKTWQRLDVHGNTAGRGPWSSMARSCPTWHRLNFHHHKPGRHCRADLALFPLSYWLLSVREREVNKHYWHICGTNEHINNLWLKIKLNNFKILSDTFRQRDGDDDAVSCPHPQAAAGNHQSCDSHKREAQFTRTCNTHRACTCSLFQSMCKWPGKWSSVSIWNV